MDVLVGLGLVPQGASKQERARALAIARAPVPPGLRAIHPTWIEHALGGLPASARAAVAAGGGAPVDVWLARWATAQLPSMIVEPELAARVAKHRAWLLVDGIPTAPLTARNARGPSGSQRPLRCTRCGYSLRSLRASWLASVRLPTPSGPTRMMWRLIDCARMFIMSRSRFSRK